MATCDMHVSLCRICAPHGDSVCHTYFGSHSVLINSSNDELRNNVEEAVATFRTILKCIDIAMAMVCHSAYPFCSTGTRDNLITRKVCNTTCQMFTPGGACEGVLDMELYPEISELMMLNCDTRVTPGGSHPRCVHVPLQQQDNPGNKAKSLYCQKSMVCAAGQPCTNHTLPMACWR